MSQTLNGDDRLGSHLAGVVFRDEAERFEQRLLGDTGTKNGYQVAVKRRQ